MLSLNMYRVSEKMTFYPLDGSSDNHIWWWCHSENTTSRGPDYTFFQGKYTDDQQVHENLLSITNHQGNANQNHNELSFHIIPIRMTIIKKTSCTKCWQGYREKEKRVHCW